MLGYRSSDALGIKTLNPVFEPVVATQQILIFILKKTQHIFVDFPKKILEPMYRKDKRREAGEAGKRLSGDYHSSQTLFDKGAGQRLKKMQHRNDST